MKKAVVLGDDNLQLNGYSAGIELRRWEREPVVSHRQCSAKP